MSTTAYYCRRLTQELLDLLQLLLLGLLLRRLFLNIRKFAVLLLPRLPPRGNSSGVLLQSLLEFRKCRVLFQPSLTLEVLTVFELHGRFFSGHASKSLALLLDVTVGVILERLDFWRNEIAVGVGSQSTSVVPPPDLANIVKDVLVVLVGKLSEEHLHQLFIILVSLLRVLVFFENLAEVLVQTKTGGNTEAISITISRLHWRLDFRESRLRDSGFVLRLRAFLFLQHCCSHPDFLSFVSFEKTFVRLTVVGELLGNDGHRTIVTKCGLEFRRLDIPRRQESPSREELCELPLQLLP